VRGGLNEGGGGELVDEQSRKKTPANDKPNSEKKGTNARGEADEKNDIVSIETRKQRRGRTQKCRPALVHDSGKVGIA